MSVWTGRAESYLLAKLVPILNVSAVEACKLVFDVDRSIGLAGYSYIAFPSVPIKTRVLQPREAARQGRPGLHFAKASVKLLGLGVHAPPVRSVAFVKVITGLQTGVVRLVLKTGGLKRKAAEEARRARAAMPHLLPVARSGLGVAGNGL